MAVTILIASALLAQSNVAPANVAPVGAERIDVAYEELANRQPDAAIARIRANSTIESNDPAALINLGSAYAMLGEKQKAQDCFRAAIASEARYDLQLADGSWMDSRRAARIAAKALAKGEMLALR